MKKNLIKADLVNAVVDQCNVSKNTATQMVECVFDTIVEALARGEAFQYRGFGSLVPKRRKPKTGRNPKTGVEVVIPSRIRVAFSHSKELEDKLG